jgi:tetratricopeptide (TPR) repeat protein
MLLDEAASERRESMLSGALEFDSGCAVARVALGETYVAASRWQAAVDVLAPAVSYLDRLADDAARGAFYAVLGKAYGGLGKVAKAVELYERALQHDAENPDARTALGR